MNVSFSRLGVALAALAAASGVAGCSMINHVLFAPRLRECDGFDIALSVFVGPSRKELRARVRGRGVDHDLPFVVETNADSLVLVGFTPLGTKAFTLVRNADVVEVESLTGPPTVPPRNVMADVLAMSTPSTCSTTPDGVAAMTFDGWQVSDTCSNGRPVKRQITRAQSTPGEKMEAGPDLEVDYLEDAIVVRQNRCRYHARYVLQASAPVVPPPAPAPVAAPPASATPAVPPASTTAPAAEPPASTTSPSAAPAAPSAPASAPSVAPTAPTVAPPATPAPTAPTVAPPATPAPTAPNVAPSEPPASAAPPAPAPPAAPVSGEAAE